MYFLLISLMSVVFSRKTADLRTVSADFSHLWPELLPRAVVAFSYPRRSITPMPTSPQTPSLPAEKRLSLDIKQNWCTNPAPDSFAGFEEMTIHHPTTDAFAAQNTHKHFQNLSCNSSPAQPHQTWLNGMLVTNSKEGLIKDFQWCFWKGGCVNDAFVALFIITHLSAL